MTKHLASAPISLRFVFASVYRLGDCWVVKVGVDEWCAVLGEVLGTLQVILAAF